MQSAAQNPTLLIYFKRAPCSVHHDITYCGVHNKQSTRYYGGAVCGGWRPEATQPSLYRPSLGAVGEDVAGSSDGVVAVGVATEGVGEGAAEVALAEVVSGAVERKKPSNLEPSIRLSPRLSLALVSVLSATLRISVRMRSISSRSRQSIPHSVLVCALPLCAAASRA